MASFMVRRGCDDLDIHFREYGLNANRASSRPWPELKFLVNDSRCLPHTTAACRQAPLRKQHSASAAALRRSFRHSATTPTSLSLPVQLDRHPVLRV